MNIAIVVNSLENKGPVIVAVELAKKLKNKNHIVDIVYLKDKKNAFNDIDINLIKFNYKFLLSLSKYDVVHSHSLMPDLINAFTCFLNFKKKIINVSTVHNNIYTDLKSEYGNFKSTLMKILWTFSWLFIKNKVCISKTMLDKYENHHLIKNGNWSYVYNSVSIPTSYILTSKDTKQLTLLRDLKNAGKKIIGSCAVITERKGLQYLLKVASELNDEYRIVIVGDGPYKECLQQIINSNKLDKVYLFDKTEAVHVYMKNFDIYIMPSLSEGFGLAAVEAVKSGCKLICSNIDTFRELFENKSLYFDVDNTPELHKMIIKSNYYDYKELNVLVDNKFSSEQFLNGYLKAYLYD